MTNVEALKALYEALGGEPADVANASTSVEVLNAIAAKYDGADDAVLNPVAISNIAAIADSIGGGGGGGVGEEVTVTIVNNDTEPFRSTIFYNMETNGVVEGLRIYNGEYYYDEYEISDLAGETTQERKYLKLGEYIYIAVPSFATASGSAEIVWLESFEVDAAKISGDCVITIPLQE